MNTLIRATATLACTYALLFAAGCATQNAQVVTEPISGSGVAALYTQEQLPPTIQTSGIDDPQTGSATTWGAIAMVPADQMKATYNPPVMSFMGMGIVNNRATRQEAEAAALQVCIDDGQKGCAVAYAFNNQCAVFFFAPESRAYGWAVGQTPSATARQAYKGCEQNAGDEECVPFYASCP